MTRLNQSITRWQGMGLMATTLLGTGVFILPQFTIAAAGDKAISAWLLLLVAVLPLGFIFAQLGRHYSSAAGPAFFVEKAFGKRYGQAVGLMFLCVVPLGTPAALMMTFEFLRPIVDLSAQTALLGELAVIAVLFFINLRGLQLSGKAQLGLTLAILLVIVAMLLALFRQPITEPEPLMVGNTAGMLSAIGLAMWSFLGIEAITHLSAEFKDAKRDFVPAVMGGLILVGIIFIACTYLSSLAPNSPLAMVGAFEMLLGDSGRWIIGVLGIASGIATVNVYFASMSRLAWSFSCDGLLPSRLKVLNQHQVPHIALMIMLSLTATILVLSYWMHWDFEIIVRWTNGVFVLIYFASMLAAWSLLARRYRPAIVVGMFACLGFAISLGSAMVYGVLLGVTLLGWAILKAKRSAISSVA